MTNLDGGLRVLAEAGEGREPCMTVYGPNGKPRVQGVTTEGEPIANFLGPGAPAI